MDKIQGVFEFMQSRKLSAEQDSRWKLNWIKLIHCYISRYDYEHIAEEAPQKLDPADNISLTVCLEPDKLQD